MRRLTGLGRGRRGSRFVSVVALVIIAVLFGVYVSGALATTPVGVTTATLGIGHFGDIEAVTKTSFGPGSRPWKASIETRGDSDLYVIQNTITPGGTFGWHSHPGPSFVIVKSGTATFYKGDDPSCSPTVVQAGGSFVDNGHDTHVVRNEGTVDLVTVVVSLVPAGLARRIDEPAPANCLPQG